MKGLFARVDANLPKGRYELAVWMDYDRDYDLDLLLGESSALMRNQDAAGFSDRTGPMAVDMPKVESLF